MQFSSKETRQLSSRQQAPSHLKLLPPPSTYDPEMSSGSLPQNEQPVTYVLYPDEGHGFRRPPNSISFYAIAEVFLATHLGGRYEPVTAETLEGSSITVPNGADLVPGLAEALGSAEAAAETEQPEAAAAAL